MCVSKLKESKASRVENPTTNPFQQLIQTLQAATTNLFKNQVQTSYKLSFSSKLTLKPPSYKKYQASHTGGGYTSSSLYTIKP